MGRLDRDRGGLCRPRQWRSVWYGAVLRADGDRIVVGEESNLQDGCVLHADPGLPVTIGRRVSVGHRAVLHGCTVADDVLVGMSATVLNGARIGPDCIIAAGTVVLEDAAIPAGSLVAGVPGVGKPRRSNGRRSGRTLAPISTCRPGTRKPRRNAPSVSDIAPREDGIGPSRQDCSALSSIIRQPTSTVSAESTPNTAALSPATPCPSWPATARRRCMAENLSCSACSRSRHGVTLTRPLRGRFLAQVAQEQRAHIGHESAGRGVATESRPEGSGPASG